MSAEIARRCSAKASPRQPLEFTTSYASAGSFSIKANYSGDGNFLSSMSATLKEVVNRSAVSVTVSSDVNPSVYGQSVTFTATLTTSGPTLDGQSVTFKSGPTILGSATISGGVASLSTSALNAGTRTVTASYSGDAAHSPASGSTTQVVAKASTTMSLTSDVNPSKVGENVTFTATVSSGTAVPTGTVKFKHRQYVAGNRNSVWRSRNSNHKLAPSRFGQNHGHLRGDAELHGEFCIDGAAGAINAVNNWLAGLFSRTGRGPSFLRAARVPRRVTV